MVHPQITRRIVIGAGISICLILFLLMRPQAPLSPAIRAPGHIDHSVTPTPAINLQPNTLKGGVVMPKLGNETAKAELGRATWRYFHTVMARYPEKPTVDEQEALHSFIYLFARLYPCGECAEHFQGHLSKYPPQVSSRNNAAGWACFIHNEVNTMLKKPEFDCSKLGEFYDCGCSGEEGKDGGKKEVDDDESEEGDSKDKKAPLAASSSAESRGDATSDHLAVEISKEATTRG